MQAVFDINTVAVSNYAERLKQINRSALPVAIRQTLNKAAYDVKTTTMPKEADRFIHRKPTFFKANSRVEQAKGFDVNSMQAIVGFVPKANDTSHSVEDLEQQENGGAIDNRSFIAAEGARVSNSWERNVKAKHRLKGVRNSLVNAYDAKSKFHSKTGRKRGGKERFVVSAIHAGEEGYLMNNQVNRKGNKLVMFLKSLKRVNKTVTVNGKTRHRKDTEVKYTKVYYVKKARKVKPVPTHFMLKASLESADKMEKYFVDIATKKINALP